MNTSTASVSVDSKGTYVAQKQCNSLVCLPWGDEPWTEATGLATLISNAKGTREAAICQEKSLRLSKLFQDVPFFSSIKMSPRGDGKGLARRALELWSVASPSRAGQTGTGGLGRPPLHELQGLGVDEGWVGDATGLALGERDDSRSRVKSWAWSF